MYQAGFYKIINRGKIAKALGVSIEDLLK